MSSERECDLLLTFTFHPNRPREHTAIARSARLDAPGTHHHVMIRGLEGRRISLGDDDRIDFLKRLDALAPELGFRCFGWVLMPNHVHLALQSGSIRISRLMARLNTGYARAFNLRHRRQGYLFQNRFRSRIIPSDAGLLDVIASHRESYPAPWSMTQPAAWPGSDSPWRSLGPSPDPGAAVSRCGWQRLRGRSRGCHDGLQSGHEISRYRGLTTFGTRVAKVEHRQLGGTRATGVPGAAGAPGPPVVPGHGVAAGAGVVQWLENQGDLRFESHELMRLYAAFSATAGDLDEDGDQDIVAGSFFTDLDDPNRHSLVWLENDGRQHFTPHSLARIPRSLVTLELADLDEDGRLDLIVGGLLMPGYAGSQATFDIRAPLSLWSRRGVR